MTYIWAAPGTLCIACTEVAVPASIYNMSASIQKCSYDILTPESICLTAFLCGGFKTYKENLNVSLDTKERYRIS